MTAETRPIARTELPFPLLRRGKVRDVYDLGDALLLVATDRVSAFDVVLPQAVPRKGEVLTLLSAWWFARTSDIVPNHLLTVDPDEIARRYPALATCRDQWERRSMLTRKLEPLPVECVVRGYISGSAWKEYAEHGTLAGEPLPASLVESDRLEPPIFSPATKAETGHDENIPFQRVVEELGRETADLLRAVSFGIYQRGRDLAGARGIIIADTKFEFGRDAEGEIFLIDEVLTPDSSRFWPAEQYRAGQGQPSLDKQPIRDYLEDLVRRNLWDRNPPAPDLPDELVLESSRRYQRVFELLTETELDAVDLETWGRG